MKDFIEVGKVKEIWRYPVKSMAGESLPEADVYWHGINGDRRASFVRGDNKSGFPWLTAREIPQLNQYRPHYTDLANIVNSDVVIDTPNGQTLPLGSAELKTELAQLYEHDVSLIRIKCGVFDDLPVSMMSVASAKALAKAANIPFDIRRWRQNIIIETFNGRSFTEEEWVGQTVAIGEDVRITMNMRIPRCVMINVDPETAVKNADVLKMVANTRQNCVGIVGSPSAIGTIRVGDVIRLTD
jgi:uncharacterized protein YcbX